MGLGVVTPVASSLLLGAGVSSSILDMKNTSYDRDMFNISKLIAVFQFYIKRLNPSLNSQELFIIPMFLP